MKMVLKNFQIVALFLALVSNALLGVHASADAGGGCPAFSSSMIDAAWLAVDYSQPGPPEAYFYDEASGPDLYCWIRNDSYNIFKIFIGRGEAEVYGHSEFGISPTLLRTRLDGLSKTELRACRAKVLGSFVWQQFCTKGIEWEPPSD